MDTNEIRKKYIKYFEEREHKIFTSDSLVPSSDPSLLFTSAGMVRFKNYYLGIQKVDGKKQRATSIQKCLRTSDIEKVGHTARHLTFFEMLGNFSFGDYFKKETIEWAWDFLTNEIKLDKKKLYVSVYRDDEEAYKIWEKIIPKNRIIKLGEDSNFWQMGDVGPCGPCSEILYDTGEDRGCGKPSCKPGCDCDRYLEIWNLVFTQYDKQTDGTLKNLPQKNIDTGMGLERLASVVQNVNTNYEIDELSKIVHFVENMSQERKSVSVKIISDHCRAMTFMVSDGILPSNEGRGYVLRRILRRALTHGKKLKLNEPFLYKVCGEVIETMKTAYPELTAQREHILRIIKMEEEKFLLTLEKGMEILENLKKNRKTISGKDAFVLYDTYGFPFEITKEILEEAGITVNEKEFEKEMETQRNRSKTSWKGSGDVDINSYYVLYKKYGNTEFSGYSETKIVSKIIALVKDGKVVEEAVEGDEVELILKETTFYGESGGQIGDEGKIIVRSPMSEVSDLNESRRGIQSQAEILDTQKPVENLIIHKAKITKGVLKIGDTVDLEINLQRRRNIMKNHTVTHLLHKALRQIVGNHVVQRGSLVTDERFRFDFSHTTQLKREELKLIEEHVNKRILENLPVTTKITTVEEAKKIGAMALFGEKYGEKVRCVIIGDEQKPESVELCGGTHCKYTGEIGQFIIVSESSIGSGLRRIEGITGIHSYNMMSNQRDTIMEISELLKSSQNEVISKLQKLINEKKSLEKDVLKSKMSKTSDEDLLKNIKTIKGIKLLTVKVDASSIEELRNITDNLKNKIKSGIIVTGSVINEKPSIITSITNDLTEKYDARSIIKEISKIVGGGGGGRVDMAQAGGKDISKLDEALLSVEKMLL
ncbi:MAG: alanine--tRNA ligase [Elusimicrobia bacterium]|nr:alanine--tRNA ligase [Elusimicrobiota bacterium]